MIKLSYHFRKIGALLIIMNILKFESTLKPSGKEYKKVVYWNRFIRTKKETIFLLILIAVALYILLSGTNEFVPLIIAAACIIYPIIVITQLNSSIKYHLAHRDKRETQSCTFTVMNNGILVDVPESEFTEVYKWGDMDKVYKAQGYYMFFNGNKLIVMLNIEDMPDEMKQPIRIAIIKNMTPKKCKFS